MKTARSRLTAQGQVSVPKEVRKHLGLAPGAILEWNEQGDAVLVRRAHRFSSEDVHEALFPAGAPPSRTLGELKEGIREHMRKRHARD